MFGVETMIRDVANYLKKDIVEITMLNLIKIGDSLFYKQVFDDSNLQECWDNCLETSDYWNRKIHVGEYNSKNRWKKRGLGILPVMFGVGSITKYSSRAGALINVHEDGSVSISIGGVESGQGLHDKIVKVASQVLEIPIGNINVTRTSTEKVPNSCGVSSSLNFNMNVAAVIVSPILLHMCLLYFSAVVVIFLLLFF